MEIKGLLMNSRYTVIGSEGGKNTKYRITCKVCSEDTELYGKFFSISRPQLKLLEGGLFCGCKRDYRYSEYQNKILLDRKAQELNMEVITGKEIKAISKVNFRCLCESQGYKSCNVRSFLKKEGNGCKYCNNGDPAFMGKVATAIKSLEGKGTYYNFKYDPFLKHYRFRCKVCEKDEMYLDNLCNGEFTSSLGNLRKGAKPCRCATNHRHTEEQYLHMCEKVSSEGFSVKGLCSPFIGRESKIDYTCPKGNLNKSSINNYLKGKRCKCCSETGFDPEKEGNLYVVRWYKEGNEPFIKIGITNLEVIERVKTQWSKSGKSYSYEVLHVLKSDGYKIQYLENKLKQTLPCGCVSKKVFPDGYTETLPVSYLSIIMEIIGD